MRPVAREHTRPARTLPFCALVRATSARKAAFTGRFRGDVEAAVRGEAVFSERPGSDGESRVFGLRLDTSGVVGGVELSWAGRPRLAAGHLPVSTRAHAQGERQGLRLWLSGSFTARAS